uniref:Major facilitator superfamily (MFS) profile domain-containing protein n=2 Tax=Meloidogyne TaxID=189290 RepID=A0A915N598_MELJA
MLKFSTQTKQKSFSSLFKNKQQLNCSNIAGPSNGNNNTDRGENYLPAPTVAVLSTVNTQPLTIIPIYGSPTPPIPRRLKIRSTVYFESCHEAEKLSWSSTDQGIVFAAQNAGSLFMLFTGAHADRLNSKWTISGALILLVLSNALLPLVASISVWLVVVARLLTGLSDALLQPSTSSLITRWFPPKERPFAIGLITGGRQIGTLLILPLAGFLCSRQDILGGWPVIFYLSALIGIGILFAWLLMSADKPSKHFCTSNRERSFVEEKIAEERLGKRTERRKIPWKRLATCRPLYIGVAALICHEYPLVIMLQLLPKYINDVLLLSNTANGFVSALPIAVLFLAKTFSSSISSFIQANKKGRFKIGRTALAKWFNGIASLGLGICVGIVPLLHTDQQRVNAIFVLCLANAFAGLHTPGVQIALLQIAPAYTGIITGIAFGCVAIFSIVNKILSNYIVQSGSLSEWTIVFWIAAVIALLPVFFFTLWGSAERQHWASTGSTIRRKNTKRKNNFGKVFPMEEINNCNKEEATSNSEQNNNNSVFFINKIEKEINNSDKLEPTTKEKLKEIKINEIEEENEELNINFDSESLTSVLLTVQQKPQDICSCAAPLSAGGQGAFPPMGMGGGMPPPMMGGGGHMPPPPFMHRDHQFGGMFGPQMPMGGGMGGGPPPSMRPGGMPPMGGGMGGPPPPHMMSSPSPFGGPMMSPPMGGGPPPPLGAGRGQPVFQQDPCCPPPQQLQAAPMLPPPPFQQQPPMGMPPSSMTPQFQPPMGGGPMGGRPPFTPPPFGAGNPPFPPPPPGPPGGGMMMGGGGGPNACVCIPAGHGGGPGMGGPPPPGMMGGGPGMMPPQPCACTAAAAKQKTERKVKKQRRSAFQWLRPEDPSTVENL